MAFWKKKKPADEAATPPAASPSPAPASPAPAVSQPQRAAPPENVPPPPIAPQASPQTTAPPIPPQPRARAPQSVGAQPPASPAQAKRGSSGAAMHSVSSPIAASLGKVVSVLMFSRRFNRMSLRELSNVILPPVMANQYLVAEVRAQNGDIKMPVGVLLWAQLSNELDQKLIAQNGTNNLLSGNEWKSGNNLWIIETVGQPKIVKAMIQQLIAGAFKDKHFKFYTRSADGTISIEEFDPAAFVDPGH